MARAVYSHELLDPDFAWLITKFQETHNSYVLIEIPGQPVLLIKCEREDLGPVDRHPVPIVKDEPRPKATGN